MISRLTLLFHRAWLGWIPRWSTRLWGCVGLLALAMVSAVPVNAKAAASVTNRPPTTATTNAQPAAASLDAPSPAPAPRFQLPAGFNRAVPVSTAELGAMQQHVKALIARVSPTQVAVQVRESSGSGVLISSNGLVMTAGHVCGRPGREVQFTFSDGRTARGKTLGVDRETDTGLMQITDPGPWPFAAMGDLAGVRVGDWVLALGHPGGYDAQRPIVARLGRIIELDTDRVQSDCTISPGDSGGPLFDMHGRVIAIHSAISESVAENFHVPVSEFFSVWDQLIRTEQPRQGPPATYIGATLTDNPAGCTITEIVKGGPAAKAGLKPGDVVFKVEGREVKAAASLRRWLAESKPGDTLDFELKRGRLMLYRKLKLEAPPTK